MPTGVHAHTPTLSAVDPRGLAVRAVAYHRAVAREAAQARVTQVRWDAAGRAVAQRDARLFAASPAADGPMNVRRIPSLSGAVLAELSTDAGPRVVLFAAAGQPARAWAGVDGPQRRTAYDDQRRPTAVYERNAAAEAERCVERLAYAGADAEAAAHNRCGRLIRHDDPAGTLSWTDYGLTGMPLAQTRRFLATLESPDWPDALPARDALLEPAGYLTAWTYDALGAGLTHTDAAGHRRTTTYTVAGQVRAVWLALASGPVQPVLTDMDYTAAGQLATQTAGNGVITVNRYDPANDRLHQATVRRGQALLQDQRYAYDPVGNITAIADAAAPVRYHRNRRIAAVNTYAYDSLGQLVEASGSESAQAHAGQPGLPVWQPLPGTPLLPYRQRYVYDAGGNLTQLQHTGQRAYTLSYTVAATSNRALPWQAGDPPPDWDTGFDAHGNLQRLSPGGAALAWNARHQLRQVTPLARADEEDDTEVYVYDGGGQRVRKVGTVQAGGRTQHREVRYLPGLELRTDRTQAWMVIEAAGVRVLQWTQGRPADIPNDQARYALSDHLGSRTQELDHTGALLSAETYYPFGGTAAWAGRNEIEVHYKTLRYSGKERDASGLYYYGFRYYAPWTQRWLNPDPAGDVDGLNRYGFVRNSPLSLKDNLGASPTRPDNTDVSHQSRALDHYDAESEQSDTEADAFEVPYMTESASKRGPWNISQLWTLSEWAHLSPTQKIVHMISFDQLMSAEQAGPLFADKAEDVFSKWDIISASLIDLSKIDRFEDITSPSRNTKTFGEVGFVIKVPPQNIIGTHQQDIKFKNHAGVDLKSKKVTYPFALADNIIHGGQHGDPRKRPPGTYNAIMTPRSLLNTDYPGHNEVLIAGRPGVSMYQDFKPTGKVEIEGIIALPFDKFSTGRIRKVAERLNVINPGVNIISIDR
jgi:insecticidal toxin complex protein TccC